MTQSVKPLTLDFGSGHDLTVCEMEPALGSMLTVRSLLGILSLPLSLFHPHLHVHMLSLSQKNFFKKNYKKIKFLVLSSQPDNLPLSLP